MDSSLDQLPDQPPEQAPDRLRLTLACRLGDRFVARAAGAVRADGIELTVLAPPIAEIFRRMLRDRAFDAAEMSLSSYVATLAHPDPPFVALPVFPARSFVHGYLYVPARSAISKPEQLSGKRIGTPDYAMTGAIWMRGLLADEFGVQADSIEHVVGPVERPVRDAPAASLPPLPSLPASFRIRRADAGQSLAQMLERNEIDALYSQQPPSSVAAGAARPLFEDSAAHERDYFRRRGILPILHAVVLRRDVYAAFPWVARSLTNALSEAERAAPRASAYAAALQVFLRYMHEQGLAPKLLEPHALFAAETLDQLCPANP